MDSNRKERKKYPYIQIILFYTLKILEFNKKYAAYKHSQKVIEYKI